MRLSEKMGWVHDKAKKGIYAIILLSFMPFCGKNT